MDFAYSIRVAHPSDVPRLPVIELAAARLLSGHAPESVLTATISERALTAAQESGHLWVAVSAELVQAQNPGKAT